MIAPNGDRIVFTAGAGNLYNIYQKAANGSSQEELLISDGGDKFTRFSNQWSHDGQFVVYTQRGDPKTKGSGDIYVFSVSEKKPIPIIHSDANEIQGQLSSDSRWMAFTSDVSGRNEIYVQPFPAADNLHKISISGGQQPRWKRDGKELYFIGADGKMMAAPIKIGTGSKPSFESGAPLPLFDSHITGVGNNVFHYDVTGDGQRFIVVTESTVSSSPHLNVWLNWSAGLKE